MNMKSMEGYSENNINISVIKGNILKIKKNNKIYCKLIKELDINPNEDFYKRKLKYILNYNKENYDILEKNNEFILQLKMKIFNETLEIKIKKKEFMSENEIIKNYLKLSEKQKNNKVKNKNKITIKKIGFYESDYESFYDKKKYKYYIIYYKCQCSEYILYFHNECKFRIFNIFNVKNENKNPIKLKAKNILYVRTFISLSCCKKHKNDEKYDFNVDKKELNKICNNIKCVNIHQN